MSVSFGVFALHDWNDSLERLSYPCCYGSGVNVRPLTASFTVTCCDA